MSSLVLSPRALRLRERQGARQPQKQSKNNNKKNNTKQPTPHKHLVSVSPFAVGQQERPVRVHLGGDAEPDEALHEIVDDPAIRLDTFAEGTPRREAVDSRDACTEAENKLVVEVAAPT